MPVVRGERGTSFALAWESERLSYTVVGFPTVHCGVFPKVMFFLNVSRIGLKMRDFAVDFAEHFIMREGVKIHGEFKKYIYYYEVLGSNILG